MSINSLISTSSPKCKHNSKVLKYKEFLEMKDGVKMQLLSMQEDQEEEK